MFSNSRSSNINNNNRISNVNSNIDIETIEQEISKCLQDIDQRYFNPNFNLMGEIVNIFGDVNFEKVKIDIERLNKIDEKLDKVIKLIVDKHSEEFFRILGFVRQMQKEIEFTKLKLSECKDILSNINNIISNLSTGENSEWKLKSVYCSEIIYKLNKTHQIFKIINDCEVYIQNNKILDAILLRKSTSKDHLNYDKEFRTFNLLVSVNIRFNKIEESIEENIINNMNNILFFIGENVLEKKIDALLNYFLNYYSKISIDNELAKPLQKFMFIIKNIVNNTLTNYNFDISENEYFSDNEIDLNSEKKLSSLVYLIKCLKNYDRAFNIFIKLNEKINENLSNLLERIVKYTTEILKVTDLTKYDLDNKSDKIKYLLFFQIFLLIISHTFAKFIAFNSYLKNKEISEIISKFLTIIEKNLQLPLYVYFKMSFSKHETTVDDSNTEFLPGESLIRMKINEILTNNLENLPILFKIYNKYSDSVYKLFDFKLESINSLLFNYSNQLYQYYSKKIIPKKFFDVHNFISEYDGDITNFKFINEFIFKLNKLKDLCTFSFDYGYVQIIKIIKELFSKYYEDTKTFIDQIKLKCIYNQQFSELYKELLKTTDYKKIAVQLEFKKYEKKIYDMEEKNIDKFNELLSNFIHQASKTNPENIVLISRNYKLLELITKFTYCTENLINIGENFILDLMKQEFNKFKMTFILESVETLHFVDYSKDEDDLSTNILLTLRILEKLTEELSKLVLICKIEFSCIIINLVKNIHKNEYWLHEPQMVAEYFINAFINDYNMFSNLFQYNLNEAEFNFITKDFLLLVNNSMVNVMKNILSNSINHFGVNLLARDFEYIKEKISKNFEDKNFLNSIKYFPNYIKILNLDEEKLPEELKKYYEILPFDEDYIAPLLNLRTSSRHTLNHTEKTKIMENIFN
jgi:hypothetical protein